MISGNNHSDDLWMYHKGHVAGLEPNRRYTVRFEVEIATSVASGCVGVGGAPGEDVTVKAGASTIEPGAVIIGGDWRMNIDKGQQANGGENALRHRPRGEHGSVRRARAVGAEAAIERRRLTRSGYR